MVQAVSPGEATFPEHVPLADEAFAPPEASAAPGQRRPGGHPLADEALALREASGERASWEARLLEVGLRQGQALAGLVDAADPEGLVLPRNRLLCAGLGLLSTGAYRALGGARHEDAVERAGALLSLLTKIDDQVIDGVAFHGAGSPPRAEVEERVHRYLAPTLRSLRHGYPVTPEGRCELAATLGRELRALAADTERLRRVQDDIAQGWRVQARAVATLSARPGAVPRDEVERITTAISAVWLRMMLRVGELPGDAARGLSPEEVARVGAWGHWIQRADALADLGKDTAEGLCSSLPGLLLWEREPAAYERACREGDVHWMARKLVEHRIVERMLPAPGQLAALGPATLGEIPGLFAFIHAFLAGRFPGAPAAGAEATAAPGG
jgi:hypothetical protein